jgi:hypothetical protein
MHLLAASDPLTAPTWLTAIFTGVLAAGAIVTAVFAYFAFMKQSQEVRILQAQAARGEQDSRREAQERRRERAASVYLTTESIGAVRPRSEPGFADLRLARNPAVGVAVHNSGRQPIYDVRVHWIDSGGGAQAGAEDVLGTLAPENEREITRDLPAGVDYEHLIPVAYFRDAAGLRWTLLPDGHLDEVDKLLPAGAPMIATKAVARARQGTVTDPAVTTAETAPDAG